MEYRLNKAFNLSFIMEYLVGFSIFGFYFIRLFFSHQEINITLLFFIVQGIYIIFKKQKLIFDHSIRLWLIFVLISIIGILGTRGITIPQILFIINLINVYFTYSILCDNYQVINIVTDGLYVVSILFSIGSVLQIFAPELLITINSHHLSDRLMLESLAFINRGWISGFFNQTGTNGFVLSVMMAFVFVNLFKRNNKIKKILNVILFVVLIYLIFMTGKRGFIIFNLISILAFTPFVTKYKATVPLIIIFFTALFTWIIVSSEIGQLFIIRMQAADFSSGRYLLNDIMLEDILSKPFFGNGTYTTRGIILRDSYLEMDGHNIYLQVLRESGLIGFLPFIIFMTSNIITLIKQLFIYRSNDEIKYLLILGGYFQILFILWGFTGNPLYDSYPLLIYFIGISTVRYTLFI